MSRGAEGAARIERVYRERYGAFLRVAVPAVLEAITDPEVPPLPPHITFEQARHFVLAVARGDSGRRAFVEQSLKAKLKEFLSGRG